LSRCDDLAPLSFDDGGQIVSVFLHNAARAQLNEQGRAQPKDESVIKRPDDEVRDDHVEERAYRKQLQ
jgi:hypothetical protein